MKGKALVGVHFRSWGTGVADKYIDPKFVLNPGLFIKVMSKELAGNKEKIFFLASDSSKFRDALKNSFGADKLIVYLLKDFEHSSKEGQIGAATEFFLLQRISFN